MNETDVLVFSFIGMKPQEIAVRGKKSLQIEMEPTTEALEEIVVIGYGSGKKSVRSSAVLQRLVMIN